MFWVIKKVVAWLNSFLHRFQHYCVLCYGRPLFHAWLHRDLNTVPNHSLAHWLWNWLRVRDSQVQILPGTYISVMHWSICFFVTEFLRKTYHNQGQAEGWPYLISLCDDFDFRRGTFCIIFCLRMLNQVDKNFCTIQWNKKELHKR